MAEERFDGIWCRFGGYRHDEEPVLSTCIDVDSQPVLDEMSLAELPEWGYGFFGERYDYGDALWHGALRLGIVRSPRPRSRMYLTDMDAQAYDEYYDERAREEGIPPVQRRIW